GPGAARREVPRPVDQIRKRLCEEVAEALQVLLPRWSPVPEDAVTVRHDLLEEHREAELVAVAWTSRAEGAKAIEERAQRFGMGLLRLEERRNRRHGRLGLFPFHQKPQAFSE